MGGHPLKTSLLLLAIFANENGRIEDIAFNRWIGSLYQNGYITDEITGDVIHYALTDKGRQAVRKSEIFLLLSGV